MKTRNKILVTLSGTLNKWRNKGQEGPVFVVLSLFLSEKEKPSEFQSMAFKKGQNSASVFHMRWDGLEYHGMV